MLISTMWTNEEREAVAWSYQCCADMFEYEYWRDSEKAHKVAEYMNLLANLLHKPQQWRAKKARPDLYWVVC